MEEGNIGTLVINYDKLMNLESEGKKVIRYKEEYAYELQNNVIYALSNIGSNSSGYISDAESYIRKKITELTEDVDVLKDFINQVNELIELAILMDQEVASLYSFNYVTLPTKSSQVKNVEYKSIFEMLVWGVDKMYTFIFSAFGLEELYKDLRTEIRYWYECKGGKEFLKICGQVVYFGLAIAGLVGALTCGIPFIAICGSIAAAIGVVNCLVGLYNTSKAYAYATDENPAMARVVGERLTLSNVLRAHNFKDKEKNKNSYYWAMTLDVTEVVLSVACLAYILTPKVSSSISTMKNYAKSLSKEKVLNGIKNMPSNVSSYITNLDNSMKTTLRASLRVEYSNGANITGILGQSVKSSVSSGRNVLETGKRYKGLLDDFLNEPRKTISTTLDNKILSELGKKPLEVVNGLFYTSKSSSLVNNVDEVIDASKTTGILDDITNIDVPSVGSERIIKGGSKTMSDLIKETTCNNDELYKYLSKNVGTEAAENFTKSGNWPDGIQIPKNSSVLNADGSLNWTKAAEGGYTLDAKGNAIKESFTPQIDEVIDRYGQANGRYTSPVVNGKSFEYVERSLPYVEDLSNYHQYKVKGDFTKLKEYVNNCTDIDLKTQIDAIVTKYYDGDYSKLLSYKGEIASVDGWGTGGGIQYEFSLTVEQLEKLGLLHEIK